MKKLISILLVAMLVIGMFPAIVNAAEEKTYVKVTTAPSDWSGDYLIVYEDDKAAFNGNLSTLDAVKNYGSVTIADNKITCDSAYQFTIAKSDSNYTIQSSRGYYIGQTSNANGLKSSTNTTYANTISMNADGTVNLVSGGAYLRFNAASDQTRFRYYKSSSYTSQKAICLYKLEEAGTAPACEHPEEKLTLETAQKDATCTQVGYKAVYTCECGEVLGGEEIDMIAHDYVDGKCTACGADQPKGYVLIDDITAIQSAKNLIIVSTKGTDTYAMSNDKGTGSAPAAVEVTVSGNTVLPQTDATNVLWDFEKTNDGLVFYIAGTTNTWLYCTNANNGVRVGNNDAKYFELDATGYLKHTGTGRFVGVYNNADWRCYTNTTGNTAGQSFKFYAESVTYPACDHTPEEQADGKAATCTETGLTNSFACSKCGETTTAQEEIPMIAHNYENGACTSCGKEEPAAIFEMGADGEAGHKDTTAVKETYTEEDGDYTLTLTSGDKMYVDCWDEMGNGGIKLGTGSVAGDFSFEVPAEVAKVIIYVAGYKGNTAKLTVNGISYTVTTLSNNGEYTAIEVDTSSTKTVTLTTASGGYRAMVNTIEFYTVDLIEDAQGNGYPTVKEALRDQATVLKTIDESVEMPFEVEVDGTTYIGLADANEEYYTYYKLTLKMSSISLRASEAGIYYGAKVECDEELASAVGSYGIVLSTETIDTENPFEGNPFTVIEATVDTTKTIRSGSVFNIFEEGREAADNAARGETAIYAAVYLRIGNEVVISNQVNWSLRSVVETIDTAIAADGELEGKLDADQEAALAAFYKKWAVDNKVIDGWNLTNIAAL